MFNKPYFSFALSFVMFVSLTIPTAVLAGDCDGTTGNDNITCAVNPTNPDANVGLEEGNDTFTLNSGVTASTVKGDSLIDGNPGNADGGNDTITINGTVTENVYGDYSNANGGNDTITINGDVFQDVHGDAITGNGGDDKITINGSASDVYGDSASGDGGDDKITINGSASNVYGDFVGGEGGNDIITINGTVNGNVYGDNPWAGVSDGDDTVIIGSGATVAGTIDGNGGTDILKFTFLHQSDLAGKDPAGDNLTHNGQTYTWLNFEQLLSILAKAITSEEGKKSDPTYPSLPLNIVSGGDGTDLNCDAFRGTQLLLPNGNSLTFLCPAQGNASSDPLASDALPADLPEGATFASAVNAALSGDDSGKLIISFDIPDGLEDADLAILHWNGSKWVEVSGGYKTADGHFEASTELTGTFVLVSK